MRARAGGREYHGRAPSAAPVLSPAEAAEPDSSPAEAAEPALPSAEVAVTDRAPADNSAVFSVGPVPAVPAEDPASAREDAAASADAAASPQGRAPSPKVPAPSSEAPAASSVEPVLSDCSSSFTQRARRFSRMRIDTSIGVPLNPKVSRRRRVMNRR